ncbi:MAG: hypothetical protein HY281_06595 [Nitrospirae bacterium]|nr:hypothetical protein [Nitrospirota bacterium]
MGRTLEDPQSRYFDPAVVLELFARWSPVRDALRSGFPLILGDLPVRATPTPSGTTDHEGRGYITRQHIEQLHGDMQYALDALAAAEASSRGLRSMGADKSKNTGRTLWDFLASLLENRTVLYWTNAVAWLLVVATFAAMYSGFLSVQIKGLSKPSGGTTSPFVHGWALPANTSPSDCDHITLQALQSANPIKIEDADIEEGLRTNIADFGPLTGWISCINPHELTLIYIGVAGDDFSDGKNKTAQLRDLVVSRLPRKSE